MNPNDNEDKIELVRLAIKEGLDDWVLFANGTFIVFEGATADDDIRQQAIDIMTERGEVVPGTSSADFQITRLLHTNGWVMRGDVPNMYVYVQPEELDSDAPTDLEVGMAARVIRQLDHEDLEVMHVNRSAG